MKKTYFVRDLIEWKIILPLNSVQKPFVEIEFTGGSHTGYGITPARFTTEDPVIQARLEASKWFANGRIYIANPPIAEDRYECDA